MKKMIKINTYLLTLLFTCFILSCDDDDLGPFNSLVTDATEDVQVTIETLNMVSAEGDVIPASVTLSRTFDVDATITLQITLEDSRNSTGTITVLAGQTSGTGTISLPGDDGLNNANYDESATVTAVAIGAEDGNGIIYSPVSNEVFVRLIDAFPNVIVNGGVSLAFTWRTFSTDDYDFFYAGASGATANAIEFITVPNTGFGDGPLQVTVDPFAVAGDTDVDYTLVIRINNPDGTNELTILEGTLDAVNSTQGAQFPLAEITRTTTVDNSNPENPIDIFNFEIVQLED